MQTLFLTGKLPGLNDIIAMRGTGHREYYRVKADIEEIIHLECLAQHIQPVTGKIWAHFTWIEPNRRRDKDNIAAGGRKLIFDGLVRAKVLRGDGWKHVVGWTDRFRVDKDKPGVEIKIDEVPNT